MYCDSSTDIELSSKEMDPAPLMWMIKCSFDEIRQDNQFAFKAFEQNKHFQLHLTWNVNIVKLQHITCFL